MVLSYATTVFPDEPKKVHDPRSHHRTQVLEIGIARVYSKLVTPEDKPMSVEFPPEVGAPPGMCGLLARHMYGTRHAADGWQSEYSSALRGLGFAQGATSAGVLRHKERQLVCSVHGDDSTVVGPCSSLDWFEDQMKAKYELTVGGRLGLGPKERRRNRCSTVFCSLDLARY